MKVRQSKMMETKVLKNNNYILLRQKLLQYNFNKSYQSKYEHNLSLNTSVTTFKSRQKSLNERFAVRINFNGFPLHFSSKIGFLYKI